MPLLVDREALAHRVASNFQQLSAKLADFEQDIAALWIEFEALKAGETILKCHTKEEFCTKVLGRTIRAVRYMLTGGNPSNSKVTDEPESEIISDSPELMQERERLYSRAVDIEAGLIALLKKYRITHYRSINLMLAYEQQTVSLQILPAREVAAKNRLFSPHATPRCS